MQESSFPYSFEDEIPNGFAYFCNPKLVELHFEAHFESGRFKETPCCLKIRNWEIAFSKLHSQEKFTDLESNLGIVSLLLDIRKEGENLFMTINTTDGRYVDLIFQNTEVYLDIV